MATQLANMARRMKISKGLRTGSRAEPAEKQRERRDGGLNQEERIFPLHQGQRSHADGVAESEAAESSGGSQGRLVGLHGLLGPPTSLSGGARRPQGVWFAHIAPRGGIWKRPNIQSVRKHARGWLRRPVLARSHQVLAPRRHHPTRCDPVLSTKMWLSPNMYAHGHLSVRPSALDKSANVSQD